MPEAVGTTVAGTLAAWATGYETTDADLLLAERALVDTVAVAVRGRGEPVNRAARSLPEAARWGVAAHALDFDDLHVETTAHISTVCVPVALAAGGGARTYLVAGGVMARVGERLGWAHYQDGWHITCTAGVFGAAAGAAVAMGLSMQEVETALALAVPAAGGVQAAFGTDGKPLQVGFAIDAGIRAARLAADGATAQISAMDQWLGLVSTAETVEPDARAAIPGRLAVKLFPCCYALQRPIQAIWSLGGRRPHHDAVTEIVVRAPESAVAPLIHHSPRTGQEGKFSLEYGVATALLDDFPGLAHFTDAAVQRPEARRLASLVRTELTPGGDSLLEGMVSIELRLDSGKSVFADLDVSERLVFDRPAWLAKIRALAVDADPISWDAAADVLRTSL